MKLSALTVAILTLGVTLACSADSGNSSASSTRCEDSATYLVAAALNSHTYATSLADTFAFTLLRPGEEGEFAAIDRDLVNNLTDALDNLGPPQELISFHDILTATGRDIARGLDLVSQGRPDEAGTVFFRIAEESREDKIGDSVPDWLFNCGVYD